MASLKVGLCILVSLLSAQSWADMPNWAKKNSTRKSGNLLTTVCEGVGPSASLARKDAINNCQVTARQFVANEIKIKSFSVETESSVGFHQEVEDSAVVKNLSCDPKKEETTELNDQFRVWIECQFVLKKIEVTSVDPKSTSTETVRDDLKSVEPSKKVDLQKDGQTVFLEVVPQCESVLVRGSKPKVINCKSNPVRLSLGDDDSEIIIRAKGFQPKTIKLEKGGNHGALRVFLERN